MKGKRRKRKKDKALKEFYSEAESILESLNSDLLRLDENVKNGKEDPDILNSIFRGVHTLKGLSGMFELPNVTDLSHNLENLLDSLRLGKIMINSNVMDLLFESIEVLQILILEEEEFDTNHLIEKINTIINRKDSLSKPSLDIIDIERDILNVLTEYEEHRLIDNIKRGLRVLRVHVTFELDSFDQYLGNFINRLKEFGEVISTLPTQDPSKEGKIDFDIIVGTEKDLSFFNDNLKEKNVEIYEISHRKGEEITEGKVDLLPSIRSLTHTVRVDINKLNNIMNIVGELYLYKSIINKISKELSSNEGFTELVLELYKADKGLEKSLSELQRGVMEVRMVPINQIFDRVARVARKLARDSNKDVELMFKGGETELDKLVVEELGDPLLHIIRNSLDHGIETPDIRRNIGKSEKGNITINAFQKGDHVIIEIIDDGRGIDLDRVREIGIRKGFIERRENISNRELYNLLFISGFSTREEISEISGRGVGMDIVKNNISRLGGIVDIESEKDKGTKITIVLPITLAIIQALIIETSGRIYAIPLNSVIELLIIHPDQVETIENKEVIELRGMTLPILYLNELFELPKSHKAEDKLYVVVIGVANKMIGIVVDELIGKRDILIKSVGELLKGIRWIAGAAEFDNQKTILVLDVGTIIEEALL
jgi:two-component system chemotaxis sensor kinase CheA